MSDQPTYEFEESDEPAKPKKRMFIPGVPGLDQQAQPSAPAAPAAPAAPTPVATPAPAPAARAVPAPAPVDDNDPDLKPGSRKDLWNCPHCGTGNRPDRETCRNCGKRPDAAKAPPLFLRPVVLVAVVVTLVVGGVVWKLTRPDLHLAPAVAAAVDAKVRRGAAANSAERPVIGLTFTPRGRLSVCGRLVASHPVSDVPGPVTTVVLLLGKQISDADLAAVKPVFERERVSGIPDRGAVVLHLVGQVSVPAAGAYLSVVGDYGDLSDGAQLVRATGDGYAVVVDELRP